MASVCVPVTLDDVTVTQLVTETITRLVTSTLPAETITTTNPVATEICDFLEPIVNATGLDPVCSLVTSFLPVVTVIPVSPRRLSRFVLKQVLTKANTVIVKGNVVVATELDTEVATNRITSPGAVTSSCTVVPTTTTTTTTPRRPSTTRPTATSTTELITTTPISQPTSEPVEEETSATEQALPTSDISTVPDPVALGPSDLSSAPAIASSSSSGKRSRSTITSFRTIVVTSIDSNGQLTVLTTSSASLNTVMVGGGSSTNVGAIAGGVVGGIAALTLLLLLLFMFRRKGLCRRSDEHFNDDVWAPANHSPGDSAQELQADDDSLNGAGGAAIMSEKHAGAARTLSRSPTGTTSLHGSALAYRSSINGSMHLDRHGGSLGPSGGYDIASDERHDAAGLVRYPSRHRSMKSSSSHGLDHASSDGHALSYESHTMPSRRMSPIAYGREPFLSHVGPRPMSQQVYATSPTSPQQAEILANGFRSHDRSRSEDGYRSFNSGPWNDNNRAMAAVPQRMPSLASSRTLPHNFAAPVHKQRPHLAVLTDGKSASNSSSTDSSGVLSTVSTTSTGLTPVPTTSPLSPLEKELAKTVVTSADSLAPPTRPHLDRNNSTDSFIVPSQFLGARIANADPCDESFMSRTESRASEAPEAVAVA
ncbi:hypothetical protein OIO90_003759 [Microbotryomycetes sp. JL221]|nr:hypothetical protein OIO90_003759 [Microbotryomycetes sp. JL221]